MPESVRNANLVHTFASDLVDKLYSTDKGVELVKELHIDYMLEVLVEASKELVVSTVSDSIDLEQLY